MAYADGELEATEMEEVRSQLAVDPLLRQRLTAFTATRDLGPLFSKAMTWPMTEALSKTLEGPAARASGRAEGGLMRSLAALFAMPRSPWAMGVALSTCLLVGTATGWIASRVMAPSSPGALVVASDDGNLVAGALLAGVLEVKPMRSVVAGLDATSAVALEIRPRASFLAVDGRPCRQFDVRIGVTDRGIEGIACRDGGSGRWTIEGQAAVVVPRVEPHVAAAAKGISPAGQDDALDAVFERLMKGAVFNEDVERRWLEKGWRQPE